MEKLKSVMLSERKGSCAGAGGPKSLCQSLRRMLRDCVFMRVELRVRNEK